MHKLTIVIAALGFLGATSLTPVAAATAGHHVMTTDISAAKAKPKPKPAPKAKTEEKKS